MKWCCPVKCPLNKPTQCEDVCVLGPLFFVHAKRYPRIQQGIRVDNVRNRRIASTEPSVNRSDSARQMRVVIVIESRLAETEEGILSDGVLEEGLRVNGCGPASQLSANQPETWSTGVWCTEIGWVPIEILDVRPIFDRCFVGAAIDVHVKAGFCGIEGAEPCDVRIHFRIRRCCVLCRQCIA